MEDRRFTSGAGTWVRSRVRLLPPRGNSLSGGADRDGLFSSFYGRDMKQFLALVIGLTLLSGLVVSCGEATGSAAFSIVGTWDLIGFSDGGVEAQTTGTWIFRANGTHSVNVTVAFPGEPVDSISGNGTYEQTGTTLELTLDSETSSWTVATSGDTATLTEVEAAPANSVTLRRQ
jgi:hypothetical protein